MSGRCRQIMLCYGQTRSLRNALTCARARAYATPKMCCRTLCCRLDESVEDMRERGREREKERANKDESCAAAYGIPVSTMKTTRTDLKSQDSSLVYTIIRPQCRIHYTMATWSMHEPRGITSETPKPWRHSRHRRLCLVLTCTVA